MSTQAAIEPHRVERQLRLGGLLALRLGDRNSRFDFGDLLADILLGTGEDCGSRSAVVRVTPIATRPHLEIGGLGCQHRPEGMRTHVPKDTSLGCRRGAAGDLGHVAIGATNAYRGHGASGVHRPAGAMAGAAQLILVAADLGIALLRGVRAVAGDTGDACLLMRARSDILIWLAVLVGVFIRPEEARLGRVAPELDAIMQVHVAGDEASGKGEIPLDLVGQTRMALRAELILLVSIEPHGIHDVLAGRSLGMVPAGSVTGLAADTERRIGARPVSTRGIFRGGETGGVTAIAFRV